MTEAAAPAPAGVEAPLPLSRREFLYYLWGVSMAVALAGGTGAAIWFALPRFKEGEFGGVVTIDVGALPPVDSPPASFADGRFWLVNIGPQTATDPRQPTDYAVQPGIKALYMVCVHLGCLYKWVETQDRFECPCHGSKYLKSDARIDGPARRNLDVFMIEAVDAGGNVIARTEPVLGNTQGSSVPITPEVVVLRVDTGRKIVGGANTKPGGGI
ncbi:MAG TPA: Rieske 2Fe-2S domain-containing protein [Anaerolineales bacterium]|nr:Rieske 2Fe-2S domain-containing protein [Anaerolineales bacterium]